MDLDSLPIRERGGRRMVLEGKAALITGAGRGIGRATAGLLVEHGARVLVNDIDADVAEQAASELGRRRCPSPATSRSPASPRRWSGARSRRSAGSTSSSTTPATPGTASSTRCPTSSSRRCSTSTPSGRSGSCARRRRTCATLAKQEREEGNDRLPQGRQRLLDLGRDGQRRAGELRVRQGRA